MGLGRYCAWGRTEWDTPAADGDSHRLHPINEPNRAAASTAARDSAIGLRPAESRGCPSCQSRCQNTAHNPKDKFRRHDKPPARREDVKGCGYERHGSWIFGSQCDCGKVTYE